MTEGIIDSTIQAILTSKVYDVAIESPLQRANKLSSERKCDVLLKREDLQNVHSFKCRGAYNKIAQLTESEKKKGVIAASAGNHAQGVALSAKKLGISALIIMPRTTPLIKIEAVRSYGAMVELAGDSYSDAAEYCKIRVKETGRVYIHPFDDPLVIAGQGTIGREIMEQNTEVTHIFVPIGGGGILAGIASYVKPLYPNVKIIGVEPEDSNAMQLSIFKNKRINLPHVGIFADGVAVRQVGNLTFQIAKNKVDEFVTVNTDQICAAIKDVFEETRSILEPAGALAVAAINNYDLPAGSTAVAVCSGANVTFERLQQVAERTLIGSGKEAMFAISMPERPGALHEFCSTVVDGHNISEFNYRLSRRNGAHVLVGIMITGEVDKQRFIRQMEQHGYENVDLSDDDLTKEHIRHMIGGPTDQAIDEQIYEVTFPERPGALSDFLSVIGTRWNISMFHYRNIASDVGSVLIGFEVDDKRSLEIKMLESGFMYENVTNNAGLSLFSR